VGPHCSFCGTFTGPFSQVQGLCTVLICIPCLKVHQAQPNTLLGLHDPGDPWVPWGCPIHGCGRWFIGPGISSGIPRPSIPAGRPPTSCCGPTRTSASGSCSGGSRTRPTDWLASTRTWPDESGSAAPAPKRPHAQHHAADQDHGDEGDPGRFQRWRLRPLQPTRAPALPALAANRRTPPAVVATEGVHVPLGRCQKKRL
jgi:hypothetical protein